MRELMQCTCVGKRKIKKKDGTATFTICYFEIEIDSKFGEGVETFSTFDNVDVGETCSCISTGNGYILIKD